MAEVAQASSFQSLLLQLERQHAKEVEELHAEIEKLKVQNKAPLGPKVDSFSREINAEGKEVKNWADDRKPEGDLQEVESVEGLTKPPEKSKEDPIASAKLTLEAVPTTVSSRTTLMISPSTNFEQEEELGYFQRFSRWIQSDQFELFVAVLVAANFFTMAAEIQYDGLQLGYELGHRFMTIPAAQYWPGAEPVFELFRTAFLVAFTTEIVLRVCLLRFKFCKTAFNIIDFIALLAAVVELFSLNLPVDPTLLRLCRLAKLFRTIRVLRVSGMLDSLSMLARCMSSSGLTLIWSLLFLLVIQLIAAMMVCLMVRPYLQDESNDQLERTAVYRFYGTFSVAVLTLFEVFFANWSPACRILTDNVTEWYSLLFLIYRCAIGFAVINVVNAVFVQQTLQVAKGDEEVLFLEKQKVGGGHLFDRRSELQIDLITVSSIPQVLSDKVYLPLVRKPNIAEVSPKTIQIARSATALPHLRLTGTGIHTGLDGCCTISTDQAVGSPKEDRLKVLTRPTWLYRWPGAPPKSWRRTAKAEGPFSARCEMPSDVVEMVGRRLFATYSPNCHQFPVQGHWVDLVVAPTIQQIWPSEVIFDAAQPTRVTATGIGFIGDLRLRIAGRLATGLQVHNDSAISFVPPAPPLRSPDDASEAFLIEVSLDGGLFWLSSGIQLTYKHLPAIYALAPTLIVQGEAIQLNISGSLTFAGEVTSLQAPPLHPLPSKVESVYPAAQGKMTMIQRRTARLLLVVFANFAALRSLSQVTFVAPKDATLPKRAKDVSGDIKTELQHELERVEALRQDSLEACLLAAEDESQLELCQELSYELNTAEQLLFKRRSDFRYVESDSF